MLKSQFLTSISFIHYILLASKECMSERHYGLVWQQVSQELNGFFNIDS
jgi:hypothetical protein